MVDRPGRHRTPTSLFAMNTTPDRPVGRTSNLGPLTRTGIGILRSLVGGICKVWFRLEILGRENIPATGAFILAPVHRSYIDTPLIWVTTGRRLRFMGKESLWHNPVVGRILTALGGFPAAGGGPAISSVRNAEELLVAGEALVIFPEGTRRIGPNLDSLYLSPAFLAARLSAPIVPVGIGGSARAMSHGDRLVRPTKIVIKIGAPIQPCTVSASETDQVPRRDIRKLTEVMGATIQALFDDAQRQAGTPNTRP
jgi:1-acyl-sn-glycerol-3-phosphate acyltransferase